MMLSPQILRQLSAYNNVDLGPHAQALLADVRGAAAAGLPLSVICLAAALIDVVQHELAGPAGYLDGAAFAFAGNKVALGWLRGRRNSVLHHETPTDGLMGERDAQLWLVADAERAITTMLGFLTDLEMG
jgi:hypothetical protein